MTSATASKHEGHADEPTDAHPEAHGDHPTEAKYWMIALFLGVVTAFEVALSYIDLGNANAPLLLAGMVAKFFTVAAFFMHLKFDSRITRRLFISGLSLAVFCYIAVFMTFRHLGPRDDRQDINLIETGVPQR